MAPPSLSAVLVLSLALCLASAAAQPAFNFNADLAWGEVAVAGTITNPPAGDASSYRIALYIQTDSWYSKSWKTLNADWSFGFNIGSSANDPFSSFVDFHLIQDFDDSSNTLSVAGGSRLPTALASHSLASYTMARGPYVRQFSGRWWKVKEFHTEESPGLNYWTAEADDVKLETDGSLTLKITNKPDPGTGAPRWYASSIENLETLGYGTYLFQAVGDLTEQHPGTVLGFFTYEDDNAHPHHRELDFEFSRWGSATSTQLGQHTVQPHTLASNKDKFTFNGLAYDDDRNRGNEAITCAMVWEPTRVQFVTARGLHDIAGLSALSPTDVISEFTFTGQGVDGIPPSFEETVHINYWRYGNLDEPVAQVEQQINIPKFEFSASTAAIVPSHNHMSCLEEQQCWCTVAGASSCVADEAACTALGAGATCAARPGFVFTDPLEYEEVHVEGSITNIPAGASADDYRIAIYVQTDVWYSKSWKTINSDWTFNLDISSSATGSTSRAAFTSFNVVHKDSLAVLKIGPAGASRLPAELASNRLATEMVARGPLIRHWGGRAWRVKQYDTEQSPGNNYWTADASDVFVNADGHMNMVITNKPDPADGSARWYASSMEYQETLGYGTYLFQVKGAISNLHPATVLGLFTYEDDRDDPDHRELDFEFSRWGSLTDVNVGQTTVQPHTISANKDEFSLTGKAYNDPANPAVEEITCIMVWDETKVQFTTARGLFDLSELGTITHDDVIREFKFTGTGADGVPTSGRETVHINFWRYGTLDAPVAQTEQQIAVAKFDFAPSTADVVPVHTQFTCQDSNQCWCTVAGAGSCAADAAACTAAGGSCAAVPERDTAITLSTEPAYGEVAVAGVIAERPIGAVASDYRIAPFVFVDGWYDKSWKTLEDDWSFSFNVGSSTNDPFAPYVVLALIPASADPATLDVSGTDHLPAALETVAVAIFRIARGPRIRQWSGYEWLLKESDSPTNPSSNYFTDSASDIFVDSSGALHLSMVNKGTVAAPQWYSSSLEHPYHLGYGTFIFQVVGGVSNLHERTVLQFYTYEDGASAAENREWDVYFSRWRDASDTDMGDYQVQPDANAGHRERFSLNGKANSDATNPNVEAFTVVVVYSATELQFLTIAGLYDSSSLDRIPATAVIRDWTFENQVGRWYPETGNEFIHIQFYRDGSSQDGAVEQHIKLPKFEHLASTSTVVPIESQGTCQVAGKCWCTVTVPGAAPTRSCVADAAACSGTCSTDDGTCGTPISNMRYMASINSLVSAVCNPNPPHNDDCSTPDVQDAAGNSYWLRGGISSRMQTCS